MALDAIDELINQYHELVVLNNLYGNKINQLENVTESKVSMEDSIITNKFDIILKNIIDNFTDHPPSKEEILKVWIELESNTVPSYPVSKEILSTINPNLLPLIMVRLIMGKHHSCKRIYGPHLKYWSDFSERYVNSIPNYDEQQEFRNQN
jgi:hypothetical protein